MVVVNAVASLVTGDVVVGVGVGVVVIVVVAVVVVIAYPLLFILLYIVVSLVVSHVLIFLLYLFQMVVVIWWSRGSIAATQGWAADGPAWLKARKMHCLTWRNWKSKVEKSC